MDKILDPVLKTFKLKGPRKQPKRWDQPNSAPQRLLSRDFILLFFMAMCSNSFVAVYYCFEQWMTGLEISPNWSGILLSSLFAMLLIFRPITSVVMLKRSKLWPMIISLAISALVMMAYPYVTHANAIPMILGLRLLQGAALAVYSSCTIGVLVQCIPPGQSARGFALFSLTMLLPYAIIPAISEELIPILGGEAQLFASMAWLGVPSFIMLLLLGKRLRRPEVTGSEASAATKKQFLRQITHSGLAFVYAASLFFSTATNMAVFFIKGLSLLNGEHAAYFFTTYSIVIILVRTFGSSQMDTLPRHKITIVCSILLGATLAGFALAPGWTFILMAALYGLSLGLLYPLLAAAVYDRSTVETRSINSNILVATFDASGMCAPLLGGIVIAAGWGYRSVFYAAALCAFLTGGSMILDGVRILFSNFRNAKRSQ